jgi:hypothetical protein
LPVETYHQDQTTTAIDIKINRVLDQTITLSATPVVNGYDLELTAGHGVITGNKLSFLEQNGAPQIYFGKVLNVVTNTVTMDTPVPFAFTPASTTVLKYDDNLIFDGSSTAVVTSLNNYFANSVDITKIKGHISDNADMDSGKFGGIAALTRGVVLRKNKDDGSYINYWNVKSNGDLATLANNVAYDEKAPSGVYAFRFEKKYGGQGDNGVVIRLEPGESIELLIQDDLTDLSVFEVMIEGHIVED